MDFSLTELQTELAGGTRDLLEARCPAAVVRAAEEKPDEVSRLWAALTELGLPGALVPEESGGLGLTMIDLLPALIETGRAAVPAPIVETAVVAAPLLAAAGRADLVSGIAAGDVVVTAAPADEPVPWVGLATHVVIVGDTEARLVQAGEVDGGAVCAVDVSRPLTELRGDGEAIGDGRTAARSARARGVVGAAAQLVGLAERQIDMTVEYVSQRRQFGAPIGSFQAVKHHLANALLTVRFARPTVLAAGLAVDADPTVTQTSTRAAVATAKTLASDAAELVSRLAIQSHGAMGYTDEYDLQLYAKRGWALASAWGTASDHRREYGDVLGIPGAR